MVVTKLNQYASDHISTGGGDDIVHSGMGADYIVVGAGNDYVRAGSGDDTVRASRGYDLLDGGDGKDTLIFDHLLYEYNVSASDNGALIFTLISNNDDSEIASNFEYFRFQNGDIYQPLMTYEEIFNIASAIS